MSAGVVRGRYAPSPTGELHLGNLRTALLAWLYARSRGGSFVLRVEDLDTARIRPGAASRMLADLRWLGLDWEEGPDLGGPLGPYTQSARHALYRAALGQLQDRGLLYPCYCSRSELARLASAPQPAELGPRYPGTCRHLTQHEQRQREAAGRRPALRFRAPTTPITFHDAIAGTITQTVAETAGDFVVRRSDDIFAYQLAVVVDDALMDVTQIVRGADLLSSTVLQLALYDALGYPRPRTYAHVPLALDAAGEKLAKRDAASGITALRARGVTAREVLSALAASAGIWPTSEQATLGNLLAIFNPAHIHTSHAPLVM